MNLRQLSSLQIQHTFIMNMTERLTSLPELLILTLLNCSLYQLPNFNDMNNLRYVNLGHNRLSQIDGLHNTYILVLDNNVFTELPTVTTPESLGYLSINNNPLKHVMSLSSFVNLYYLQLINTTISFIPPTIDKLQNLWYLSLSHNKLFYLPKNILKLSKLTYLDIQNNPFPTNEIETIKREFSKNQPNVTLNI
jgi:Leucine-rich repeat (LRR) protein